MPAKCILYYISDRSAFPGDESERRRHLLEKIREGARAGVDYIQLREKDLSTRELESLARAAMEAIRDSSQRRTALLINSRTDVALAVGGSGVHLRSADILPEDIRTIWKERRPAVSRAGTPARQDSPRDPVIGVSCHSPAEVASAAANAATFAVFAPVFEKKDAPAAGLKFLQEACLADIPVLALGGITLTNAHSCLAAGAAGIAAIRLFQDNDIDKVAKQLRS